MRRLTSLNPSTIDLHLNYAKEKVEEHKILSKLSKLVNNDDSLLVVDRSEALNKIDD